MLREKLLRENPNRLPNKNDIPPKGDAKMIKIMLADDDPIVLQGMSMIISARGDMEVVVTASNGNEAVTLARKFKPDVALLDIRMPGLTGIEAAEIMLKEGLSAPLLLTTFDEPELIEKSLAAGTRGYILKNSPPDRILAAIEAAAEGSTVFAPDVVNYIREAMKKGRVPAETEDVFATLTPREKEIVALVSEGLSNTQISERLYLADGTVRNHISTILEKTALENRTQIAIYYNR
jgi:DNA-binding NarL/FixJ family response regulator